MTSRTAIALLSVSLVAPLSASTARVLFDNGPLVTHPGGGYGGADASRMWGYMQTYGFGNQFAYGHRLGDDFLVPAGGWNVGTIVLFAYQTGSPTSPSPITGVYLQIWNGYPGWPGSSVVFGDLTTNRLVSSVWSGIYRDSEFFPGDNSRPIMANTVAVNTYLPPGTYFLDWLTDGSPSYPGPWVPAVTILDEYYTGNAQWYSPTWDPGWQPLRDYGFDAQQGLPFIIYAAEGATIPEPGTIGLSGVGLVVFLVAAGRRKASNRGLLARPSAPCAKCRPGPSSSAAGLAATMA